MLDPRSWSHLVESVPMGRKMYFDHDCGAGRTLCISQSERGYSAFCFRCNDTGWLPPPRLSLAERIARLQQVNEADHEAKANGLTLPHDLVYDVAQWPTEAAVWLYKAGLGKPEIATLRAGYSPRMDRVVIPVYAGDQLVFWQARGFMKDRPKYLAPEVNKDHVIACFGTGTTVLTEDLLSAFKVGLSHRGIAVMGTALPTLLLNILIQADQPVIIWLDPDKAGSKANRIFLRKLRAAGVHVVSVRTEKDPKLHSREEIDHEVHQALRRLHAAGGGV